MTDQQTPQTVEINSWGDAKRFAASLHSSPLDHAFDWLTYFNWITPLGALIHQLAFGAVGFNVPDNGSGEWAGLFAELTRRGIRWRWRDLRRGCWHYNVPGAQARYAMWVMDQLHLTYSHSPIPRRYRAKAAARGGPLARLKAELFN